MRPVSSLLALGLLLAASKITQAIFMNHQTKQASIECLFKKLELKLAGNSSRVGILYPLARLHAMAYSTNLSEVSVRLDDEEPVFGRPGSDAGVPVKIKSPDPAGKQRH